jgi:hypothetical protein
MIGALRTAGRPPTRVFGSPTCVDSISCANPPPTPPSSRGSHCRLCVTLPHAPARPGPPPSGLRTPHLRPRLRHSSRAATILTRSFPLLLASPLLPLPRSMILCHDDSKTWQQPGVPQEKRRQERLRNLSFLLSCRRIPILAHGSVAPLGPTVNSTVSLIARLLRTHEAKE